MSSYKARNRTRRTFGHFEELESRLPLAGNITTSYNAGTLFIQGDASPNSLRVESTGFPGQILITGLNDGQTNTATSIDGFPFSTWLNVSNIQIALGGGNDQVLVQNVTLNSLIIAGEAGDDLIEVGTYVPLTTPNPANNVQTINGPLTISAGSGADTVRVNYVYNATAISIFKSGSGADFGRLNLSVYVAFCTSMTVQNNDEGVAGQNPSISNDTIFLGYVSTGQLYVDTGDGSDLISYYACRSGQGVTSGYGAIFLSGSGDDYVALDVNIYDFGANVDTGSGNDTLQFSRAVFMTAAPSAQFVVLYCGTGNDTLLVGKYFDAQAVLRDSGSTISQLYMDLGPGNDTATIVTNVLNQFFLFMGSGDDNAYFGSNVVNSSGLGQVWGDLNWQLNTSGTGNDRVRRFNNTMDAFSINYTQLNIESTVFGAQ